MQSILLNFGSQFSCSKESALHEAIFFLGKSFSSSSPVDELGVEDGDGSDKDFKSGLIEINKIKNFLRYGTV